MESEKKIIAFSGKKRSGKNTSTNFVFSLALYFLGLTPSARVDDDGLLVVVNEDGEESVFDISRTDKEYLAFADDAIHPYIRKVSFADPLKEFCVNVLGLAREQVFGTTEQKESPSQYRWEDMPFNVKGKKGIMTAREVIQQFGTQVFRKIDNDLWCKRFIERVNGFDSSHVVVDDCRFPNEVDAIHKAGGKVIRLTRNVSKEDEHESEKMLDKDVYDWANFDYVIDNENLSIHETNEKIVEILSECGWVDVQKAEE